MQQLDKNAIVQAKEFRDTANIDSTSILTKLDGTAKGGESLQFNLKWKFLLSKLVLENK